ncbi:hypothetical protein KHA80_11065 [Anaerobacillus sp. HL2]|nr:hypothetical protein KHA80_11065 [Anaerobacillus sp. HL2]
MKKQKVSKSIWANDYGYEYEKCKIHIDEQQAKGIVQLSLSITYAA